MSAEKWPVDAEFRRFAAKVADAVMVAINNGTKLVADPVGGNAFEELCPLGCIPGAANCRPFPSQVPVTCLTDKVWAFAQGFDGEDWDGYPDYHRLGREYRRRALGEAQWGER